MKNNALSFVRRTLGAVAIATSLVSTSAIAQDTEYPEMTIKVGHALPETFIWAEFVDKWFFSEVERRSGGKIKMQVFWSGSLIQPKQVIDAVGSGAVAMGADAQGYYPSVIPLNTMPNALLGTTTFPNPRIGSMMTREIFEEFPEMQEEWSSQGVWPLYFNAAPNFRIACTSPIETVADMKGKKMRQFSAYHPTVWSSLDAVGVTVLPTEVYEGLQRGRLDCGFYDYSSLISQKLYEQAKYVSTANFGAGATWPMMVNYDQFFNEWPESVRTLITEVAQEAEARSIKISIEKNEEALQQLADRGVTIVEFSAEEQAKLEERLPDFIDTWIEQQEGTDRHDAAMRIGDYMKKRIPEME